MAGLLPPPGGSTLHAAFLGLAAVLVSVLADGSPVAANDPWLDSSTAQRFLQDGGSWHTVAPGDPASTAATQSVPPPGAQPSSPTINLDTRTFGAVLSQWGLSPSQDSKSFTPSDLFVEGSKPLSTPPLSPSEPALGPSQQTEGPARLPRDLEVRGTSSALLSPSHGPLNVSEQQPRSNASTPAQLKPSTLSRPTTPQFVVLTSDRRDPSEPPVAPNNQMEAGQSLETVTSLPDRPFEPPQPSLAIPEFHPDMSHSLDYFSFEGPAVGASSKALGVSELSPSRVPPMQQDEPGHPGGVHSLLNSPPDMLVPSDVPFVSPQPTPASVSSVPTQALPEDFFPTNTMDVDWGSGDYMETMSFLGPEGDDYSLVTNLPSDMYDLDDQDSNTETYDTAFPSRVGLLSLSSTHLHLVSSPASSSFPPTTVRPFLFSSSSAPPALEPTATVHSESLDVDWSDALTVEPTDVLLPDMNSVEYYTTQLTRENASSAPGAEQRGNVTTAATTRPFSPAFISTTHIMATSVFTVHPSHMATVAFGTEDRLPSDNATWIEDGASTDLSGFEPANETTPVNATAVTPQLVIVSEPVVESSVVPTRYIDLSSYLDGTSSPAERFTPTTELGSTSLTASILPSVTTPSQPDEVTSSSLLADISWFITESVLISSAHITPVWTTTATSSPAPTTQPASNVTASTDSNATAVSAEPTTNATSVPPVMVGDQGATDRPPTTIMRTSSPVTNVTSAITTSPTKTTTTTTTSSTTTTTTSTTTSLTTASSTTATRSPTNIPTSRQYLCNVDKPTYLVKVGFPVGATVGFAKAQIKDILKVEFNKSVELQVVDPPPRFVFRAVSGPVVYTAISVINALRRSGRRFLSVSPSWTVPDHKYQVHTVLQFVPAHIDVRVCNFSERIEKGLTMAFAEVRRRSQESTNFTVHTVNITMVVPRRQQRLLPREPVDIIFAVRAARGYLMGSEVSGLLMKLTMVEFSYYMGFPVLQIAEPFHYPELNTTQLLRSSWVRTVLLGVPDQGMGEQTFQAQMERRLALLLGEALGTARRVRRATSVGNNSVQIVSTSRLPGPDNPLEVVYFVEGPSGSRLPAVQTANTLNSLDVQRAAIVLGYRVQGVLAQSVEKVVSPHSDGDVNTNVWIVIGVVIPLLLVVVIISILYWKLCRTDKLEFQPDAMSSIQQQQRQKTTGSFEESRTSLPQTLTPSKRVIEYSEEEEEEEEEEEDDEEYYKEGKLQAPSVKGFDFAKLHLGQHSKEDLMVGQDPSAPPGGGGGSLSPGRGGGGGPHAKDGYPSYLPDNSEVLTPKSKSSGMSSAKATRNGRRRGRISPSDGDSVNSDRSSDREAVEENPRGAATPSDGRQGRKMPINVLTGKNRIGPPPMNGPGDQLSSSASIFEHVDRMSRSTDAARRPPNKIQLIAMQPMPLPPLHSPSVNGRVPDNNHINKEINLALRHKSEIEHHRNKIRLRAKRKGHYDFPAMDHLPNGFGDAKDPDRVYQKARMQIDKILDPDLHIMPSIFSMEPKKSGRGKRSPKQRKKEQLNGSLMDADKDQLISNEGDATYRRCPGVSNVAYVSDPDQGPGGSPLRSPSPTDNVFLGPSCSPPGHAPPPPPYMPPQPSIEEARQQMHSLLDNAFALVSPTSPGVGGSTAGITLPGVSAAPNVAGSSPPARGPRQWSSSYPVSPFSGRYGDVGLSPPSVHGLLQRQGLGASSFPPLGESSGPGDQLQADSLYTSRARYSEELPSSARPRPVGGTTGAQLHHLTQVGLPGRLNGYPPGVSRAPPGQNGGLGWNHYHDDYSRPGTDRDAFLGYPDYSPPSIFQMPRSGGLREPSAPPAHLEPSGLGYPSPPEPMDPSPPTHSSASLIKAIREELMRLSQKQAAVPGYHS